MRFWHTDTDFVNKKIGKSPNGQYWMIVTWIVTYSNVLKR